jgi:hypothetical protein
MKKLTTAIFLLLTLTVSSQPLRLTAIDHYTDKLGKNIESISGITYTYWHLDSAGTPSLSLGDDNYGQVLAAGDFNSDGYQDLAVGAPAHNFIAATAGAVFILYGTINGLSSNNSQILSQQGSSDSAEFQDAFGSSLATGDFNGDGYQDLVVGTPLEDVDVDGGGVKVDAGAINVFYGSVNGLSSTSTYITAVDVCSLQDGCQFGFSLAAGDVNDDGFVDLAVSAPYTDLVNGTLQTDAGLVIVYPGQATVGITQSNRVFINQGDTTDAIEAGDLFGWSLEFGYFNESIGLKNINGLVAYADLIIGAPNEDVGVVIDAGMIHEFHGSSGGLVFASNWTQGNINDLVETGDLFGFSLASGDFNGDFNSDLVVGVPFEDIVTVVDGGAVNIIYGTSSGLTSTGSQTISQNSPGIFGVAETSDLFGFAVATGRLNTDGYEDVVISTPLEDYHFTNEGFVQTIFGSNTGLNSLTSEYMDIPALENDAHLGNSLAAMSFQADVAVIIGAPSTTSIDGDSNSGMVVEVAYKDYDLIFRDGLE